MAVWSWYEAVELFPGAVDLQYRGNMLCDRAVTLISTQSRRAAPVMADSAKAFCA